MAPSPPFATQVRKLAEDGAFGVVQVHEPPLVVGSCSYSTLQTVMCNKICVDCTNANLRSIIEAYCVDRRGTATNARSGTARAQSFLIAVDLAHQNSILAHSAYLRSMDRANRDPERYQHVISEGLCVEQ